ncbi:MAG: hypothetical protein L3J41_04845 [Melioribacteraceae bacterium]|nr:hypothetical protein [Melioribacteraceae bacterium]
MKNHKSAFVGRVRDEITGEVLNVSNLVLTPSSLGEIAETPEHYIEFTANNSTGTGTITGISEYGHPFSFPVEVFGEFDLIITLEGAGNFYGKLYDIDLETGNRTPVGTAFFINNKITFSDVVVDIFDLVIESWTINSRIYETYVNTSINSYFSETHYGYYMSDKLDLSGNSEMLEIFNFAHDISDYQTVSSAMDEAFTFESYIGRPARIHCADGNPTAYTNVGLILINTASSAQDHLDKDVLLHEFGHYAMDYFTGNMLPYSSAHSWSASSNIPTAYKEGWATFFVCYVKNNPTYQDINPGSPTIYANVENLGFSLPSAPNGNI